MDVVYASALYFGGWAVFLLLAWAGYRALWRIV